VLTIDQSRLLMDGTPKDSKGGKGSAAEGGSTCKHVDGRNSAPVDIWFIPSLLGFQPFKAEQDFATNPWGL